MKNALDEQDFERLLDQHGGEPARWPPDAKAAAERLLASSGSARAALVAAKRTDALLDGLFAAPAPPLGLKTRILAHAEPRRCGWRWSPARAGLAACAPLVLGLALGLTVGWQEDAPWEAGTLIAFSITDFADFEVHDEHAVGTDREQETAG